MLRCVAPVLVRLQKLPNGRIRQNADLYIGHAWSRQGWSLPKSKWASPFPDHDLKSYETYVTSKLQSDLQELTGKVIGCWCIDPAKCHGSVLIELWKKEFPNHVVDASLYLRHFSEDGFWCPSEHGSSDTKTKTKIKTQETHPNGIRGFPWPAFHAEHTNTIWIDEAGMGSWAGPLHVTGTVLKPGFNILGLHDSKLLTEREREHAYRQLIQDPNIVYHTEIMTNDDIDSMRLGGAWREAIRRIVKKLKSDGIFRVVLDGDKLVTDADLEIESVPKADRLYMGVAAASIIAKVSRDQYMVSMAKEIANTHPEFIDVFRNGKGYRYREIHKTLLEQGKYTPLHRKSFNPLKTILDPPVRYERPKKLFRLE